MKKLCLFVSLGLLAMSRPAFAQDGATLFKIYCAACHEPATAGAPARDVLQQMRPEQILQALEKGAMRRPAAERQPQEIMNARWAKVVVQLDF